MVDWSSWKCSILGYCRRSALWYRAHLRCAFRNRHCRAAHWSATDCASGRMRRLRCCREHSTNWRIHLRTTSAPALVWIHFTCCHCTWNARYRFRSDHHVVIRHRSVRISKWRNCTLCSWKSSFPRAISISATSTAWIHSVHYRIVD